MARLKKAVEQPPLGPNLKAVAEQPPLNPKWLTIFEAAHYLRVSPQYVRRVIHAGELKAIPLGGSAGFRVALIDLDQFMLRRKRVILSYAQGLRPWVAQRHAANRRKRASR